MIVKEGEHYCVKSKSGKSLGKYKTKGEAEKRLKQVEYYKNYEAHKEHEKKETKAQEKAEHKK